MYKTAVYTLVNVSVTQETQQVSEKGDIYKHDISKVSKYF